jgi:peroxin-1
MSNPRKTSTAQADLVLLPTLKNCLLNLPSSLVAVLLNSNTVAQNVIVELSYRQNVPVDPKQQPQPQRPQTVSKSIFLGWTGMQSKTKLAAVVGREGIAGRDGGGREKEVPTVEIDGTFARLLGLGEGMKVRYSTRASEGFILGLEGFQWAICR